MHQLGMLIRNSRKQCERADVRRRGRVPLREMYQLGVVVGDDWKRYGCNDEKGRGMGPYLEML